MSAISIIFLLILNSIILSSPATVDNDIAKDEAVFAYEENAFEFEAKPELENLESPGLISAQYIELTYLVASLDLPLYEKDYYWGKYENGKAGAEELNIIPPLDAGDKISVIGDGYITVNPSRGYIQAQAGYYYGSGLCWATSTLGGMMDVANKKFMDKYGLNLFVFNSGSRYGHSHWYQTYAKSNNGYGYTIIKISSGPGQVDYTFQINPKIQEIAELKDVKFRIVMAGTTKHPNAYKGQSISAKLYASKDIFAE